jgi:hypothetical protein
LEISRETIIAIRDTLFNPDKNSVQRKSFKLHILIAVAMVSNIE